jgi:hypothetical protein
MKNKQTQPYGATWVLRKCIALILLIVGTVVAGEKIDLISILHDIDHGTDVQQRISFSNFFGSIKNIQSLKKAI